MTNNDITVLLYRIKENIRAIENGDVKESQLNEVRSDFLDMIELIKLFLISERDSYYGYFLMNMQTRANFCSNSIAGIRLNEFPAVFESNPLLLCKFSLKEIIYIVCHEIEHIVLNHPAEMVKVNPEKDQQIFYEFNLAADAAVNDRINYEIVVEKHKFMSEPEGCITSFVLADMFRLRNIKHMENYAYYFGLIRGKNDKQHQTGDGQPQNGGESMMQKQNKNDGTDDFSNSNDSTVVQHPEENSTVGGTPENSGYTGNNGIVTSANCGGKISDHEWNAGNDTEDAAAVVRELVNASVGMMNDESRSLMPGYFMSEVEKINKPPVLSWQAILKKYVGTITADKKKTRTRLNRRQPERFDLSGSIDDKVLKIVVAIDTSGSVDDHMIGQIMNEIFAILAKRKHDITIIECDAQVRRVYKAVTPADVKKKVTGRGGTWFSPVIEYINEDKYFRDALLIYFTDGYGETNIPRPRTYRNMWVVIDDARHLSLKEPYGIVLSL